MTILRKLYRKVSHVYDPSTVGIDEIGNFFSHRQRAVFQYFGHGSLDLGECVVVVVQQSQTMIGVLQRK